MSSDSKNMPEDFKKEFDKTLLNYYLQMDANGDCTISKNEWMISNLQLLFKDVEYLEKQGPDSIMKHIKDFSDEFDKYDQDGDKFMQFADFKEKVKSSVYICED